MRAVKGYWIHEQGLVWVLAVTDDSLVTIRDTPKRLREIVIALEAGDNVNLRVKNAVIIPRDRVQAIEMGPDKGTLNIRYVDQNSGRRKKVGFVYPRRATQIAREIGQGLWPSPIQATVPRHAGEVLFPAKIAALGSTLCLALMFSLAVLYGMNEAARAFFDQEGSYMGVILRTPGALGYFLTWVVVMVGLGLYAKAKLGAGETRQEIQLGTDTESIREG